MVIAGLFFLGKTTKRVPFEKVYFTGTDNLGGPDGDLQAVKPYFFTTVPRLLEKVYEKIYNTGLTLTGFKKKLLSR